jgi:hypothetical protein
MDWIKRNLYFVIGSVVAVVLMGLAGFYLWTKYDLNTQIMTKLNELYAELGRLNSEVPHPGSGTVDNIQEAKKQQQQLAQLNQRVREYFQRIPAIPDTPKVSSQEFSTALSRTIDQLQKGATNASVTLPADYSFSFAMQRRRVTFAQGSLEPLSVQLGEVKAICDVLFAAKINSLDNIRRERVSTDDSQGPQTDYLDQKSVTNELAVVAPYELDFRCFSSELAGVLAGFASSSNSLMVKTLNVEPAPSSTSDPNLQPFGGAVPVAPVYAPPPRPLMPGGAEGGMEAAMMRRRYGLRGPGGEGGGAAAGGIPLRMPGTAPAYTPPPVAPAYTTPAAAAAAAKGGLPTVLDEKQLRITMLVQVVKLLPPAK